MSTPSDILTRAFGYSTKNKPSFLTDKADELRFVVVDAMRALYLLSAKVNPERFSKHTVVNVSTGGWTLPTDALAVFRLEDNAGKEIIIVPRSQLQADEGRGAVWVEGNRYYSAGNPLDPTSGSITFFYTKTPDVPGDINANLDALWPTTFDRLLALESAMYLAAQDGRADDVAALQPMRDGWATSFITWLDVANSNIVRQYGNTRNINIPDLIRTTLITGPAA